MADLTPLQKAQKAYFDAAYGEGYYNTSVSKITRRTNAPLTHASHIDPGWRFWEDDATRIARYNNAAEEFAHKAEAHTGRIDAYHEGRMEYQRAVQTAEEDALRQEGALAAREGGIAYRTAKGVVNTPGKILGYGANKVNVARNALQESMHGGIKLAAIGGAAAIGVALLAGMFGGKKKSEDTYTDQNPIALDASQQALPDPRMMMSEPPQPSASFSQDNRPGSQVDISQIMGNKGMQPAMGMA